MLKPHVLGFEALVFIRDEVARTQALRETLADLPLEDGRALTFLPETVTEAELIDFGSGGVASGEETPWLAELVIRYVNMPGNRPRLCVLEHPYARRGDPWTPGVPFFTVDDAVFLPIERGMPHELVVKALREAHGYPSVGILAHLTRGSVPRDQSAHTNVLLSGLAQDLDHLVIGAYDGEAWVIWSRPGQSLDSPSVSY